MSQERIMVVDGDRFWLEMLRARFEAMDYRVECARTGVQALKIFEDKWIDLIVLAISLPGGISGFHLFKEIKKKASSEIPIIMQSSRPGMEQVFEKIGAEAFFIKPYSAGKLLARVKDILG